MDHFSPADFAMLCDEAYEWLATLLNLIEDGAPWPKALLKGKAAYLSKGPEETEDPFAYRVLLILPVLYIVDGQAHA